MVIKNWEDVVEEDFPHPKEITKEMVEAARRQTRYTAYCGARIAMGRILTTKEIEDRRQHALQQPLYRPN